MPTLDYEELKRRRLAAWMSEERARAFLPFVPDGGGETAWGQPSPPPLFESAISAPRKFLTGAALGVPALALEIARKFVPEAQERFIPRIPEPTSIPGAIGFGLTSFGATHPVTPEEAASPLMAAAFAVPPAGAVLAGPSLAAARAAAAGAVRRGGAEVLTRVGAPQAALRVAGKPQVAGAAIPLERGLIGNRITRFLRPDLQEQYQAAKAQVEGLGLDFDALAGTRPDEFFLAVARPTGSKGKAAVEGKIWAWMETPGHPELEAAWDILMWAQRKSGPRGDTLYFSTYDDLQGFLSTGKYVPPRIVSPLRPGPIEPLYLTVQQQPPGYAGRGLTTVTEGPVGPYASQQAAEQAAMARWRAQAAEAAAARRPPAAQVARGQPEMHPTLGRPLTKQELALRERLRKTSLRTATQPTAPPPRKAMTARQRAEAAALERELGFRAAGQAEVPIVPEGLSVRRVPHPAGGKRPYYRVYRESDGKALGGAEQREAAIANAQGTLRAFREHPELDISPITEPVRPAARQGVQPPVGKVAEAVAPVAERPPPAGGPMVPSRQAAAKEPWQMTQAEHFSAGRERVAAGARAQATGREIQESWRRQEPFFRQEHRKAVEEALYTGKPVPPEVLAEYPELAAAAKPITKPLPAAARPAEVVADVWEPELTVEELKRWDAFLLASPEWQAASREADLVLLSNPNAYPAARQRREDIQRVLMQQFEAAKRQPVRPMPRPSVPPIGTPTEAVVAQPGPVTGGLLRPVPSRAEGPPPAQAAAKGAALPSGRVPGGLRAEPLPPRQPPPPTEPPAPPMGELPSGRRPGGPQNIRPAQPVDNYQRVVDALTPERDPLIKRVWNSLPRLWYDRNYPFKAISEQTGVPVRQIAQAVPGSGAAAENIVRTFYRPVRDLVGVDEKRLLEYLVLRRNDDILARNPAALLPGGVQGIAGNIQALKILYQQLGPVRFAKVEAAAKELWRLNNEMVLQPMVAWGKTDPERLRLLAMGIRPEPIISKKLYQELRTSHPHYVSFKRADFTDFLDEIETSFGRPEVNIASTGLKRMDLAGSERRLSLTFQTLVSDVYRTQALLARNRAAKSLADALIEAQRLTGDEVIRFIEPSGTLATAERVSGASPLPMGRAGVPPAKLDGKLSFYHEGEKYMAQVPREVEAAAKGLYAEPSNLILNVLRALAQPLRRGATEFDPFFLPVNVIRDSMSALFREKMIPFGPDHLAGLWGAIRKNALFEQAANDGALISGFVETGRGMGMRTRSALGALNIRSAGDALLAIPRALSEANVIFERGTRVGVYRKLLREVPNPNRVVPKTAFSQFTASDLARINKVVRTRDATVDFSKSGTAMQVVNQVVPFLNPATQGAANIGRTIRDHPARFLALAAGFGGVAALVRLNNMRFETSELIPDYEYIRYWIVQFGEGERKDGTKFPIYLRIPKGEFVAATTFPVEAIFHTARANEDRGAVEMLLEAGISAAEVASPLDVRQGVFGVLPPLVGTAGGLQLGVDPFSRRPIVPRREEQRLPEQQFGAETSAIAIELGQRFGISPRKIDFAIKDYTAGAGKAALWLTDMALEILGYTKPEVFGAAVEEAPLEGAEAMSRTPLGRVFGTRATQLEWRGWEQFDRAAEETQRQFDAIPGMNALGISLGKVDSSFDMTPRRAGGSIDLTPQQRAEYQRVMAELVTPAIAEYVASLPPEWPSAQKKKLIEKEKDAWKDEARDVFRERLWTQQAAATPQAQPSKPLPPEPTPDWEAMKQKRLQRWQTPEPTPDWEAMKQKRLQRWQTPEPTPVGAR